MTGLGFLMMVIFMTLIAAAIMGGSRRGITQQQPQGISSGYGSPAQAPLSEASRHSLDSDITRFGDELRDLDLDVVGRELDAQAKANYADALDAYENSKQALRNSAYDSDAKHIAHILEEGRYKIACVKAQATGRELPQRRPPCFFDPAHGPSTQNISWTPDGGAPREVPACALDAARVTSGYQPQIRMVAADQGVVPYWQDRGHAAWAQGYYGSWGMDPVVRGMAQGMLISGGISLLMNILDHR